MVNSQIQCCSPGSNFNKGWPPEWDYSSILRAEFVLRHRKTNGITHVTAQPLSGSAATSQWLWPDPCCNAGVKFYKKLHYLLDSWMFTMLSASNKLIRAGNSNLTVNKFCGQPCDWCTMQWHHSGCYILLWHCLCKIL